MKKKRNLKKALAAVLAMTMCLSGMTGMTGMAAGPDTDGQSDTVYTVTIDDSEHGTLAFAGSEEKTRAFAEGESVSLNATAKDGYVPDGIVLTDDGGQVVDELTGTEDTEYSFTMPAANLHVSGSFKEDPASEDTEVEKKTEGTADVNDADVEDESAVPAFPSDIPVPDGPVIYGKDSKLEETDRMAIMEGGIMPFSTVGSICTITPGASHSYGSWFTREFRVQTETGTYNGFCVQPEKPAPSGQYTVSKLDNDLIKALLMIAPGYPFHDPYGVILYEGDNNGYAYAHAALSYAYGGSLQGLSPSMQTGVKRMVDQYGQAIVDGSWALDAHAAMDEYQVYIAYNDLQHIVWLEHEPKGWAQLQKSSADTGLTDGNPCYSLAGAQYGVYKDAGCSQQVATFTTGADGNSNTIEVDAGTYYVKETVAPPGYAKDNNVYTVTVNASQTSYVRVSDTPVNDPNVIELIKIDKETGDQVTQGAASLAGAQFTINYYAGYYEEDNLPDDPTRSWVIETKPVTTSDGTTRYITGLTKDYLVEGDDFYFTGNNPNPTLPLGTITVQETMAPDGYLLDEAYLQAQGSEEKIEGIYVSQIRQQDSLAMLTGGNTYMYSEQVRRGDFSMTKLDEETQEPMEGIPFRITSNTTGESHEFMTDANGHYSSESDYAPHSEDTNSGKADSGIWFGLNGDRENVAVDDEKGALPYDTYTIEELRCEANGGKTLYRGQLVITKDGFTVDLGNIENADCTISTQARDDATDSQYAQADDDVTIVDEVSYTGLKKTEEYTLVTTLMDKSTHKAVVDEDGQAVTASKEFTPKTAEGKTEIEIHFDATGYAGKDVVVFQELRLGDKVIAEHKDYNSIEQTIHFPSMSTQAVDNETNSSVAVAGEDIRLVDTVTYTNLEPGRKYQVTGTLMDPETKRAALDDHGSRITAEAEFTAKDEDGTVEVVFNLDGKSLAGKTYVVFEQIEKDNKVIASHEDYTDEDQTLYFPSIGTTAKDKDTNINVSNPDGEITIVDTVVYQNLDPYTEYTLKGQLMDQESGEALLDDAGKKITAETTFAPTDTAGEAEVTFTFSGEGLAGKNGVVFEALYFEDTKIAFHEDLEDEGQMVFFPSVDTHAADSDSELGMSLADGKVTIVDTLSYENLPAGEYIVKGRIMDADTGEELLVNTKEVTAQEKLDNRRTSGEVEMTFEFDGTGLAGRNLVVFERIETADGKVVAQHEDLSDKDQMIKFPAISTSVSDSKTGVNVSKAGDTITVTDTVTYQNVMDGVEYTLHAQLYDKETGEPAIDGSGREITEEIAFTPNQGQGIEKVTLTFDGEGLDGKTFVVYETLMIRASWFRNAPVAEHHDLDDELQTVYIPALSTSAKDQDSGMNAALADGEVTIVDTVSYENLKAGTQYTVKGQLMDKDTGKALLDDDGEKITAETSFIAEDTAGTAQVTFTFPAETLEGQTAVAFEELYLNGKLIGQHKDIDDEGQTVYMPKVRTSITDLQTEENITKADGNIEIRDTVSYENVEKGQSYEIQGRLVDKATGETIKDDEGKDVTASTTFKAAGTKGTAEVTFKFAAKGIEGKTLVAFEDLLLEGKVIGRHADLEDTAQTTISPKVRTTALDSDTQFHVSDADGSITVIDSVNIENVIKDRRYTVEGILMDRETGEPALDADGNEIKASETFVADKEKGSVDLTFTFNGEGLEGKTFVAYEELFLHRMLILRESVGEHKDINDEAQSIHIPKIATSAVDSETKDHISKADGEVTVTDTLSYENLVPGVQYEARGFLVDQETGEAVVDDNAAGIEGRSFFTPDSSDGTVDVTFTFPGKTLEGRTVVVYEDLYYNGEHIAEHHDLTDTDQTIHLPKVRTTALDKDTGDHISKADEEVTVTDTVTYETLIPGYEYVVRGQLLNRDTSEVQKDADGKPIESETTFIAEHADGTVDVTFVFNGEGMDPTTLVCFEDVLLNGVSVAEHSDLADEGQTVRIPHLATRITDSETSVNMSKADDSVTATDTVTLTNLLTDRNYVIKGALIDKETGEVITDANGDLVVSETTFNADLENDTKEVVFKFNGTGMEGKTLVAYEELFILNEEGKETSVAEHRDLTDELQNLHLPKIMTTALDTETKDHIGLADDMIEIVDTVKYENVIPGYTYLMGATVRDAQTGEEVPNEIGTTTTWTKQFKAETSSGTVEMRFEIPAKALEGKTVVVYENLSFNGKSVAEHKDLTDELQSVHIPMVRTTALDTDTSDHVAMADGAVTIVDTVNYKNVLPGKEYEVKGVLYNQETGEKLVDADGSEVTAETTFMADAADGSEELVFTFNGEGLEPVTAVAFEEIYYKDVLIGRHTELSDEEQSVHLPFVDTQITDNETEVNMSKADGEVTVTDTVTVENLVTDRTYLLKGYLMDPETGEIALDADGNKITAENYFVGEKADAQHKVIFTFNGAGMDGRNLVAYEELYLHKDDGTNVLVGEHKAMDDAEQTLHLPKVQTIALDSETNDHLAKADEEIVITDTVRYENVLPDLGYIVKGQLIVAETGDPVVDAEGNAITAETSFTAGGTDGETALTFTVPDGGRYEGLTFVCLEELFYNGVSVAEHKDASDEAQSVHIPKIRTQIIDSETGYNVAYADILVKLTDEVSYENLIPGYTYVLSGVLVDKETGETLKDEAGREVKATKQFTAEEADGVMNLVFTFDASSLEGKDFVAFEELYYKDVSIGEHKDLDDEKQTIHFPKIGTQALDDDTKEHISYADGEIHLTDTVAYTNLSKDHEYVMKGQLMDQKTGEPMKDDSGNEIVGEARFTAKKESGKQEVTFTFAGDRLEDTTGVVFEKLYVVTADGREELVADHQDLDDKEQTIHFPEITTTALDSKTGDHIGRGDDNITIQDEIFYKNLIPGLTYTAQGILMDQETGKPALDDKGEEIRSEATFTAKEQDGSVVMEFTFNGTGLQDHTLVAFEKLYYGEALVADHEDIEAPEQSVQIPWIGTTALDSETGEHVGYADGSITVRDTVAYKNLLPGQEYEVEGRLYDRDTETCIATATETFTAEDADGTVTIDLTAEAGSLAGHSLVVTEEVFFAGVSVAVHKDLDDESQTVQLPAVATSAKDDESGAQLSYADDKIVITDTVKYENVVPGLTYRVEGLLMDRDTGNPLLDADGNEVHAQAEFTPEKADGSVDVSFAFDGHSLGGHTVVVFEKLYLGEALVADHQDISDDGQSIWIPKIGTQAVDAQTDKQISLADDKVSIVDTVTYENLIPGLTYTVKGVLMDQSTGESAKDAEGNVLNAEATFTAETADGSVDVEFTFDGSKLGGITLVAFEQLYYENTLIASHEDIGDEAQSIQLPKISTMALTPEGGKNILASEKAVIEDTITYENLEPGIKYIATGTLVYQEDGEKVLIGKGPVIARAEFTPKEADGKVKVEFTFDASSLAGETVVVYETVKLEETGEPVAVHKDLEDTDQTLYFPAVRTHASFDGKPEATADRSMTVTDEVSFANLIPGRIYRVEGVLMDKETGEALLVDGQEVRAEAEFEAKEPDGTAEVIFTFDGGALGGKDLVVFEKLYDVELDTEIARHEDFEDEDQTVTVLEKPPVPVQPQQDDTPEPSGKGKVQTGDDHMIYILIGAGVVLLIAAGGTALAIKRKKK
uniref:VaFE repeat-containing surface-anchored protein n=1 Tax=Lachnoclostridium phocaeense TaxID=1871021 RepID=UPI0026DC2FDC|nr:VaFE repeat-containing surface-anchored protein [Lachnoclostridium phocaeense]